MSALHLRDLLDLLALFALSYGGMFALSMAMDRHYADLRGRGAEPPPAMRRRLQLGGAAALALALAASVHAVGGPHGLLLWLGALTGTCLLLVLLLSYAPRAAALLGVAAYACGSVAHLLAGVY
ncbi:DUF3325 domain-containing protein [Massilia sp. Root418]|uniref:DUF3325 domain-containing protein n=1 Tax=Massilia sp. Root418 TaxID=1736532 RepID=UPI000A79B316|nr:DUF3325 domain-containing protein [Massilia sp. Root418]